jgi:hypothetical protein
VHSDEDSFVLTRLPIRVNDELASTRGLHVPTEIVRGAPICTACNARAERNAFTASDKDRGNYVGVTYYVAR